MVLTESQLQEIAKRVASIIRTNGSKNVGQIPIVDTLDGITTLPAVRFNGGIPEPVTAPVSLLQKVATDVIDETVKEAEESETLRKEAEIKRDTAEKERVSEFGQIKTDAEKATGNAIAAVERVDTSIHNAGVATDAANAATAAANQAAISANQSASNADGKAILAEQAAASANDTADHPTYIGTDHYAYKWNKATLSYDKTDIYCKGDAFSIKKVYASVAALQADVNNATINEGDFVLVNTNDVENPDNAKLYVKVKNGSTYAYDFLVDMSGAIGFTGKTPQFSMGNVTTLEAGSTATATVSEDGVDGSGNPRYKVNFAIPRGNPGAPFRVAGQYATIDALKAAVPNGSAVDGFMAVGDKVPYNYYAWVNGAWADQGQIAGGSGKTVVIPSAVLALTGRSTSAEILNAFDGKNMFVEIVDKVKDGAPVSVKVGENNIMLFQTGATVDTNAYTLSFIYIDPMGKEVGKSYLFKLSNDIATLVKTDTGLGFNWRVEPVNIGGIDTIDAFLLWELPIGKEVKERLSGVFMGDGGSAETAALFSIDLSVYIQNEGNNYFTDNIVYTTPQQYEGLSLITCVYGGKTYLALRVYNNGMMFCGNNTFMGYYSTKPLFQNVSYISSWDESDIINQEIYNSVQPAGMKINTPVNSLLSSSTDMPLSAAMGKKLNDEKQEKGIVLDITDWLNGKKQRLSNAEYAQFIKWRSQPCNTVEINTGYFPSIASGNLIRVNYIDGGQMSGTVYMRVFIIGIDTYDLNAINIEENDSMLLFDYANGYGKAIMADGQHQQVPISDDVQYIKKLTQAQYDALVRKDNSTLYIIT